MSNRSVRKLPALAAALVLISTPTAFERDLLIDPAERLGWIGMADAIARVRFEGHRPIPSSDEALTQHTAVVLGIFKTHERLRVPATRIEIVERRGFMQTGRRLALLG